MRLAQSQHYGLCVAVGRRLLPHPDMAGLDARIALKEKVYRSYADRMALVDLVMGHVSRGADREVLLNTTFREKYEARAELFADESERVLRRKGSRNRKGKRPRVLVIGATAGIIRALLKRGFSVCATDLSSEVVGSRLAGVKIKSGREANARAAKEADLAIITNMTLPNGTLAGLIEMAKEHNTSTILWAITGRNCGHYYTESGVDSVISDPSPFLLLPGPATMAIWRRSSREAE